jgi:hypothetical protein
VAGKEVSGTGPPRLRVKGMVQPRGTASGSNPSRACRPALRLTNNQSGTSRRIRRVRTWRTWRIRRARRGESHVPVNAIARPSRLASFDHWYASGGAPRCRPRCLRSGPPAVQPHRRLLAGRTDPVGRRLPLWWQHALPSRRRRGDRRLVVGFLLRLFWRRSGRTPGFGGRTLASRARKPPEDPAHLRSVGVVWGLDQRSAALRFPPGSPSIGLATR